MVSGVPGHSRLASQVMLACVLMSQLFSVEVGECHILFTSVGSLEIRPREGEKRFPIMRPGLEANLLGDCKELYLVS